MGSAHDDARPLLSVVVPVFNQAGSIVENVDVPKVAPARSSVREQAAAAISESRVGGGSLYYRFTPGNIRLVRDFPASSFGVRRDAYLQVPLGAWLAVWIAYVATIAVSAAAGGLRFRSFRVAALTAVGIVLTHIAYVGGFVRGVAGAPARDTALSGLPTTGGRT